jgi:hypothetical protein
MCWSGWGWRIRDGLTQGLGGCTGRGLLRGGLFGWRRGVRRLSIGPWLPTGCWDREEGGGGRSGCKYHLQHWTNGGPNELDNLVLLCYHHHRKVHEGGWQLVKSDDGSLLTIAPLTRLRPWSRSPD